MIGKLHMNFVNEGLASVIRCQGIYSVTYCHHKIMMCLSAVEFRAAIQKAWRSSFAIARRLLMHTCDVCWVVGEFLCTVHSVAGNLCSLPTSQHPVESVKYNNALLYGCGL